MTPAKKTSSSWITGNVRIQYANRVSSLIFRSMNAWTQFAKSTNAPTVVLVASSVVTNVSQIMSMIGQINAFLTQPVVSKAVLPVRMMSISAKNVTWAYSLAKNPISV